MRKTLLIVAAAALTMGFAGSAWISRAAQSQESKAEKPNEFAEIETAATAFQTAFNKGDAAVLAALFAEKAEVVDEDENVVTGRDNIRTRFAEIFKTKTRDEWTAIFEHTDACTTPVLSPAEVAEYRHNTERNSFVTLGGALQPGPAPRFSRTPSEISSQGAPPGAHTDQGLAAWGIGAERIAALHESGAIK